MLEHSPQIKNGKNIVITEPVAEIDQENLEEMAMMLMSVSDERFIKKQLVEDDSH